MIAHKILSNVDFFPQKVAISYLGNQLSYADLQQKIEQRVGEIDFSHRRIIIAAANPIEAIVELLALQLTLNAAVIISDDLPPEDVDYLKNYYGLQSLNENISTHKFEDDYFLGVLTSGSSGSPKIIWKDNACWESAFPHQSTVFGISSEDRVFIVDAVAYSANLNAALHALWQGATVVFASLRSANSWPLQFTTNEVSSIFLVPSHLRLIDSQQFNENVNSVVTAGEKLSPEIASKAMTVFPNAKLTEYYGAAELGHISFHQDAAIINNPLSVGRAFPEVKIKINGNQLTVQSPYVSPEYRASGTVQDLGYWENDNLILIGRFGRMFNRRGLNVFAQEIEHKAIKFPNVAEVRFERIEALGNNKFTLFYAVKAGQLTFDEREFKRYLQAVLPPAKRPDIFMKVAELPRLNSGKINVTKLRKVISTAISADKVKTMSL